MAREKLNKIVQQHVESSTAFWAGKTKLSQEELTAIETFAKKKGKGLDEFFSNEANRKKVDEILRSTRK